MATYYAMNAGGNWQTAATWSTVADKDANRAANPAGSAPTNAIDCVIDDYSGNVTVDQTTCVCKSLDCTGHTGTLTFASGKTLTASGSVTFVSGMTVSGTGYLTINAAGTVTTGGISVEISRLTLSGASAKTLNTNGTTWPSITITAGTQTITLSSALQCNYFICSTNFGAITFSGAYNITSQNCSMGYLFSTSITFVSGQTLTITGSLVMFGKNYYNETEQVYTVKSGTASSKTYIRFTGSTSNCMISGITFTDVEFNIPVYNYAGGTLTRTTNITNATMDDIGSGGGNVKIFVDGAWKTVASILAFVGGAWKSITG